MGDKIDPFGKPVDIFLYEDFFCQIELQFYGSKLASRRHPCPISQKVRYFLKFQFNMYICVPVLEDSDCFRFEHPAYSGGLVIGVTCHE